ncbi:MAG: hypothetical protein ACYS9X_04435 [Planctomycetota bacterium]
MSNLPQDARPDKGSAVEVTASLWRALLMHLFAWAIGAGGFSVLFPILRWYRPDAFGKTPPTPQFVLLMALTLHVVVFVVFVFWVWYRMHHWRFSERGVECTRLGRRVWFFEWEQIAHVWLAPFSVVLYTDAGPRFLLFADRNAVREAIPSDKLKAD